MANSTVTAAQTDCSAFSPYTQTLDETARARYNNKLGMLGGMQDPYITISTIRQQEKLDWLTWPDVEYPDIYNYFVATPSSYTRQQLKAYKSLDAYKYFLDGWVSDVLVWSVPSCPKACVVSGKVKHSQRLSASSLQPWVAVEKAGLIICAHCNCMAGLGEACSHVAALLFLLEANSQLKKNTSCTSRPCYWLPPTFKNVPFSRISDIDFMNSQRKRRKVLLTESPESGPSTRNAVSLRSSVVDTYAPSKSELDSFYTALSEAGKPVILSIIPIYCDAYIPLQSKGVLPQPLSGLYKEDYLALPYLDLLQKCEDVFDTLTVTSDQAKQVEKNARDQSSSKIWFQQRAARITSSKFKAAARTDMAQPSQSLIRAVCYPESTCFTSKATDWGCTHEKRALTAYKCQEESKHSDYIISSSGLVISTEYPHMGASPDGVVSCSCCGRGVLEVKCPYSCNDKTFLEAATKNPSFFLEEAGDKFKLKHDHMYYYQIQLQMKLCETTYGDFIVWRENELSVERILIDEEFLEVALEKATKFFIYGVLPEVLGKWYSKLPDYTNSSEPSELTTSSETDSVGIAKVWCFCEGDDEGDMIACDNPSCKREWFHIDCLRLTSIPKGKWFCPDCSRGKQITQRGKNKA